MWNKRITDGRKLQTVFEVNPRSSLLNEVRQASPMDEFYRKECTLTNGVICQQFTSDVYLLFHQQNLSSMSQVALSQWLEKTSQHSSSLASLRSKMSDKQLGAFIKSRYIQSPSELLRWSNYLEANYQSIIDSLPVEPAPEPVPEPTPEPAPESK